MPTVQPASRPPLTNLTKAERRQAFAVAIREGSNITEASRMVGVSRTTGHKWHRELAKEKGLEWANAARATIISKTEVAEALTQLIRGESDPRDKVVAAKAVSELMGYNAPSRSEVTQRVVQESVITWLADAVESNVIDAEQLTDNDAPKALGE